MKTNLPKFRMVERMAMLAIIIMALINTVSAQPQGAVNGTFTVNSYGDQVYFSQGNLQYQASTNTWRFAENQWDYVGSSNSNISQTYSGWIDLLGWGTSGWDSGNTYYHPWDSGNSDNTLYGPLGLYSLNGDYANADWGVYNAISNGGNQVNLWRILTHEEWSYVLYTRATNSGIRFVKAKVNNVRGIVLLPNDWSTSYYTLNDANQNDASFTSNVISASQWALLEQHGAVFLPAAGGRNGTSTIYTGFFGHYWTGEYYDNGNAWFVDFYDDSSIYGNTTLNVNAQISRSDGCSVRLVHTIQGAQNPTGSINGKFSVNSDGNQVYFSKGNLQYIGSAETPYWKFAENQWDYLGDNGQGSTSQNIDRDLFGWGTSGYNHGSVCYQPWSTSASCSDYYAYGNSTYNLNDQTGMADWGYNAIINGGNQTNKWRTLTKDEWMYLFNTRNTLSGIRYAKAQVNGVKGAILLPDDWSSSYYSLNNTNTNDASFNSNTISASQWNTLEQHGAIFLPAAGARHGTSMDVVGYDGNYWSASYYDSNDAYYVSIFDWSLSPSNYYHNYSGHSVRLVCSTSQVVLSYSVIAQPNPAEGGTVTGTGNYQHDQTCTLTATANEGYTFVNWTENNEVVSTNATYQFTVSANRDLVANFEEYIITNHYVCDITQFADYMSVVAVVVIDGVEQESETLEMGAFCGDECRGGKFATYFPPTQRYIYQMPVYGAGGDNISFKLYNHDLQQEMDLTCTVELQWQKDGYGRLATPYEITFVSSVNISASVNPVNAGTVTGTGDYMLGETATLTATANEGYVFANWTEGANVVSENPVYSFTVDGARTLVANFNAAQSYTLSSGWNWWSTYIEQTGSDGLTMLEEGLGEHGEFIQSRTGTMVENFDGYFWWGDLNSVTNEDMYEVKTNAQVDVVITGSIADPTAHPITIAPGWNWIGYVSNASNSVDNALSSLTPNADDIIQGRNGFSSYFPGWGWYGDIDNMTPGQGYMYKSYGTASQTLVYPAATRSTETDVVDYHYNVNYNKYRNVMDVMANVVLNGSMIDSDKYELAAFVEGECRGISKLQYVEPLDTYLAFLTINGNADEIVTFGLYDENSGAIFNNHDTYVVFKSNEVLGKLRSPYTICFNGNEIETNGAFAVYPNPVATGDEITVDLSEDFSEGTLFIENELGLTVDVIKLCGKSEKIRFDLPSGVYVLRVVTEGNIYYNKVIVK